GRGRFGAAGAWGQCAPAALDAPVPARSASPLGAFFGHVISSLGFAVRLNRAWLFRVRQTAEEGRATGLRRCPNDLPVFRFQHYSARHTRTSDYCYPILCHNVTASLIIVGAGREAWVVPHRERGKTVCARGASLAPVPGRSVSPLGGDLTPALLAHSGASCSESSYL